MPGVIAVDFGGTNTRAAFYPAAEPPAQTHSKLLTPSSQGPEAVVQCLIQAVEAVLPPSSKSLRIGVAAPGPLDPYQGVILQAPNLPGVINFPLRDRLQAHFRLPVALGNDANLAALGEWKYGAGRGVRNLLLLTIGTGIGGGAIVDGKLVLGARGLAGELGHMRASCTGAVCGCGQPDHLEAVASGPSMARAARARLEAGESSSLAALPGGPAALTAQEIAAAAREGDPLALSVLEQAATAIGEHLAGLTHAFNPEVIIIGGGVAQVGALLLAPIERALRQRVMHPAYLEGLRLLPGELGDDAGLTGAMILGRES